MNIFSSSVYHIRKRQRRNQPIPCSPCVAMTMHPQTNAAPRESSVWLSRLLIPEFVGVPARPAVASLLSTFLLRLLRV